MRLQLPSHLWPDSELQAQPKAANCRPQVFPVELIKAFEMRTWLEDLPTEATLPRFPETQPESMKSSLVSLSPVRRV